MGNAIVNNKTNNSKKNINVNNNIPNGVIFGNSFNDLEHAFLMLNNQSCRICNKKMLNIINYDYRYDINCKYNHSYHTVCLMSAACESYDKYFIGCDICHIYLRNIPSIKEAMQEQNTPEPLRRSARIASMKKINYTELNDYSDNEDDDSSYEESDSNDDYDANECSDDYLSDDEDDYENEDDDEDVNEEIKQNEVCYKTPLFVLLSIDALLGIVLGIWMVDLIHEKLYNN